MNEPRRLKLSGGAARRLLDSAAGDGPGARSRERAALLVSTSGGMSRTANGAAYRAPPSAKRTSTLWMGVGVAAAAAVPLAFAVYRLADTDAAPAATEPLVAAEPPTRSVEARRDRALWVTTHDAAASREEQRALTLVEAAAVRGDDATALAGLERYAAAYPQGRLRAEAAALRVQLLLESGNANEARRLARQFLQEFAHHPLSLRVAAVAR